MKLRSALLALSSLLVVSGSVMAGTQSACPGTLEMQDQNGTCVVERGQPVLLKSTGVLQVAAANPASWNIKPVAWNEANLPTSYEFTPLRREAKLAVEVAHDNGRFSHVVLESR